MNPIEAILFAIMQGVTELFPISSLGHSVLIPEWLHWSFDRQSSIFLPFMVMLHLGTALALLLYFREDWIKLVTGFIAARGRPSNAESRLMLLLVTGTIPAGLLGLLFEKKLRGLFGSATIVLVFLAINGLILLWGDRLKRRQARHELGELTFAGALRIGVAQALALFPGISRSGVTLVAGLGHGLDYASAARFSFLLATPIIGAAGVLEIPKLLHEPAGTPIGLMALCGVISGVCAYLSTWFLMRYFKTTEIESLRPFGWYCILVGVIGLALRLL